MAVQFLTKNSIKLFCEKPYYFRLDSKFYVNKDSGKFKVKEGEKKMDPPVCVDVTPVDENGKADAATGAPTYIIVNKVLKDTIETQFPDGKHVGKAFMIVKHEKASGKNYNLFDVGVIS